MNHCAVRHSGDCRWLETVVMLAIVLRVAILVYAERNPTRFDFPDSRRYVRVARNIMAGKGPIESEAIRAGTDPLYPYILSVGSGLGLQGAEALMRFGRVVNAVCGVVSVVLLAALARGLVGDRAALIAAGILACDPILLFFHALVLTETCYTTLLLGCLYGITRLQGPRAWRPALFSGIAIGLATLMRSSNLFLPLILVPCLWHFSGPRRANRVTATAVFLIASAVVLAPWVARNYRLFGRFVPVRTGSGASLLEAWGPWADGAPGMDRVAHPAFPPGADEYTRDRICRKAAIDWARHHPRRVMSLAWVKLRRTWSITVNAADFASPLFAAIAWTTVAPEFALALAGAWMLRRRCGALVLLLAPALYFTLVHMVFVGSVRYRVPVMPMLFALAGVAVDELIRARGKAPGMRCEE